MNRKRLLAVGSLLIAALAATALYAWRRLASERTEAQPAPVAAAEPHLLLPATIQAYQAIGVPAPIEGTIESLEVEVGDEVFEGQLLARIKNTGLESAREEAAVALERAQEKLNRLESTVIEGRLESSRASADASRARSEYERAERNYQRQQILVREGATPRLTFEKAEKEYNTAKSEFESLEALAKQVEERVQSMSKELDNSRRALEDKRQDLEHAALQAAAAEVRAPMDGWIVARRGAEGDEVSREIKDLFQIAVDLSILQAVVELDPKSALVVRAGQPVLLHFQELSQGVQTSVKEVKDGRAILDFPNPGPSVRPGVTTAQARIRVTQ